MNDNDRAELVKYRMQRAEETLSEVSLLIDKRQTSDYSDFIYFDLEEVKSLFKPASELVLAINKLVVE